MPAEQPYEARKANLHQGRECCLNNALLALVNVKHTVLYSDYIMTQQPIGVLQIVNAAAQRAYSNYSNHIATNFFPRTMRWIRLQLLQIAHFTPMPARGVASWVRLLCRAATENSNIAQLLPIYTSLAQPPADVIEVLEYLVATMQALLGPLPVTEQALRKHPESYLNWLHLVLTEFQAAQGTPYAPKLLTLLPQTGHQISFIKISTTSLHK